jgi:uncharacterized protein (TIGR01777 family)
VRVLVAGGSGFLGRALQLALRAHGHSVAWLTRTPRPGATDQIPWTPDGTAGAWTHGLDGVDALVNLAGEGIADRRWTAARKQILRNSRILSTRSLVAALRRLSRPPAVFVSGSAVGYYGARGDEPITEASPPGTDFLANLCAEWEREAEQAATVTRVATIRTGLVLHPEGGALRSMLPPFRLGIGGRLSLGTQFMPWIHRTDWAALVEWIINTETAHGAFNGTAPAPVTNAEFTRALGRVLQRPTIFPVPAVALRVMFGELADSLLTGQFAIPARAESMGFRFTFRRLEEALADLFPNRD